jgi:hypothetical protein
MGPRMRARHETDAKCGNQIPKTAPFEVLAQHKILVNLERTIPDLVPHFVGDIVC